VARNFHAADHLQNGQMRGRHAELSGNLSDVSGIRRTLIMLMGGIGVLMNVAFRLLPGWRKSNRVEGPGLKAKATKSVPFQAPTWPPPKNE